MALKINKQTWVQMKAGSSNGLNLTKSANEYQNMAAQQSQQNNMSNNQISGSAF
jgi:hypothetical protein